MLSERLKEARKKKKLTQEELAIKVNTTKGTISNYENGHSSPSNEMLTMLADVLDVSTDWLLGRPTGWIVTRSKESPLLLDITPVENTKDEKSLDELLQEKIEDPDDYFFLDGYLDAPEDEKKELRRFWYEMKKKRKENNIETSEPISLRDFNEKIKKPD